MICPNSYKEAYLNKLNQEKRLENIKYLTIKEYQKLKYFDYDYQAIYYLHSKGFKIENCLNYLDNLYYIENKDYHNDKLNYLVKLKEELDNNKLLIYNYLPKYDEVIINGYGNLDSYKKKMFDNYTLINYEEKNSKFKVYEYQTIEDEVENTFNHIIDLLTKGIDINKIFIMNIDSEYYPIIKRYSSLYQINVLLPGNENILGTTLVQNFLDMVKNDFTKEDIYQELIKEDNNLNNTLINLLNEVDELNYDYLYYRLSNIKTPNINMDNVIKIKNVFDYIDDSEYIFFMNFNNHVIPKLNLDIDYITDDIKELVGLDKTVSINKLSKENTFNYLKSINNLIISYKDHSSFNKYYPSILLDDMDYELLVDDNKYQYNDNVNKDKLGRMLDDYLKYGYINPDLELLYSNYGNINYLTYDNNFKGINKDHLHKYLNNHLTLSYSSIDNYYHCAFQYYLSNILNLNLYEETYYTILGNLFHYLLSIFDKKDFDFDNEYNKFISKYEFNNCEKFFINKLKNDLKYVIDFVKEQRNNTFLKNELHEEKFDIKINEYINFKGFVDKVLYLETNDETLVSVIDYKTGNPDIKIKYLPFGLSMQLPVYLYLIKNSKRFHNMKVLGIYLQHILNNEIVKSDKLTYEEQKKNNLKLRGFSINDTTYLEYLDKTYNDSEMIMGMKTKKDGTLYSYAHGLSEEEFNEIEKIVSEKIKEASNKIWNGEFSINPKIINKENIGCKYCSYRDICYLKDQDKVYINITEEGDDNELDSRTESSD